MARASIAGNLLDPTYDGRGVRWRRGVGIERESFARDSNPAANEAWQRSPFRAVLDSVDGRLRRRLDASYVAGEFPMLDGMRAQGMTDYLSVRTLAGAPAEVRATGGMVSSWTTDVPGGFDDAQIAVIEALLPTLALAFMLETARQTARTLLVTYLGEDAAERVLAGNIVRGRAETIRAVVWFSDITGFTPVTESAGAAGALALLNDYAEVQVDAIERHGGHVLKFIGDAVLAIFPEADAHVASARALDAAVDYRRRLAALRAAREAAGLPVVDTHLALHVGELLYGNVGSARRLDFTVLGPAVNAAARIEALCGALQEPVIVSSAFAAAAVGSRYRLVSLGAHALKGIALPQEMFALRDLEAEWPFAQA